MTTTSPPPIVTLRRWPAPTGVAGPALLAAASAAGALAALAIPLERPGVGWLVAALGAAAAVAAVGRGTELARHRWVRVGWAVSGLALMAVSAVRASPWLSALCVLVALGCGSLAVAGGRSPAGLLFGVIAVPVAAARALPWTWRGARSGGGGDGGSGGVSGRPRLLRTVLVTAVVLTVFGGLLAGADDGFAALLDAASPDVPGGRVLVFALVALAVVGAGYLLVAPHRYDELALRAPRVRLAEWVVPAAGLVALFAAFIGVQLTVLFGGSGYVLDTPELTYAQYARSGFWQLCLVTGLTLLAAGVAWQLAPRETPAQRRWLRVLLGATALLSTGIVASALSRMWTYQQAYGFTVLRVLVSTCELWLGAVHLLVLASVVRLRAWWLPRAAVGLGVAALLVLAVVDPERMVADENVRRYQVTGEIDLHYLAQLSADAAPALAALPAGVDCQAAWVALRSAHTRQWPEWNLSRAAAERLPVPACASAP